VTGMLFGFFSDLAIPIKCAGDHPATSVAIAAQAGIVTNPDFVHHFEDLDNTNFKEKEVDDAYQDKCESIVITGPQLDAITPMQEHKLYTYQEIVFARTTPEQKLRIVRALQARESVVAMTGDGVRLFCSMIPLFA
jgi:sodium/potassium-transporting ATPase subunit alpha